MLESAGDSRTKRRRFWEVCSLSCAIKSYPILQRGSSVFAQIGLVTFPVRDLKARNSETSSPARLKQP